MLISARPKPATTSKISSRLAQATWLPWLIVIGLTVLAFFMRRKGLATQSLWFDEADLIARAERDPGAILADLIRPGENGPLYTLFMHFWLGVAGVGEAAVRTPSLLAGTAVVPLIYELGRKFLGGPAVGLVAAGLVAISPYQLWYSQDAKMYPLALLLTLASVYLFLTALERGGRGLWGAYVILTTLSFYIHLMSVLIVAVEVVYYWLLARPTVAEQFDPVDSKPARRRLKNRAAVVSLGLLTLPYLPIAVWQARALWDGGIGKTWFGPVGLLDMFDTLTRRFAVNRIDDPLLETFGAVLYAGLALLGLIAVWRIAQPTGEARKIGWERFKTSNSVALLLTLYLLLPILAFYVLTTRIPLFADRYLLIASPAYYLLVAWGIVWLARRMWPVAVVGAALAVALAVVALFSFNYAEKPQKEDWREAMRWLQGQLRDGDEVLIVPGYLQSAVGYYLKPDPKIPVYALPQPLLQREQDRALNGYLTAENGILRGHERVWLVVSPDRYQKDNPEEYVRRVWFNYNTYTFSDPKVFLGVTIYGFTPRQIPGTDSDYFPRSQAGHSDLQFGSSLSLEGFDVVPTQQGDQTLPAGQVRYDQNLHLTFYWRKIATDSTDYEMRVRLLDKDGHDTDTNYAAQPLNGYLPTSQWRPDQAVRDYRDLYIHVPPGSYSIELSVYPKGQPQSPLPISSGTSGQPLAQQLRLNFPITVLTK